jgi:hypothetical protein
MVRTFIIATTAVATLFSSAAFTQGPGQGTASIPDFSGVWTREYTGVEPPLLGPGPVRNPLFRSGVPEAHQIVGDHTNPILKPGAAEVVKKHGEMELSGMPVPSARNQCWPEGVPAIFNDVGILMFQQPDKVTILYDYDHEVRRVRMNQSHPPHVSPSWYGDTVGPYEGDTLVIDTVGVKVGPFAMIDIYGTPHSPALHVVERYRLIDYEVAIEAQERGKKVHTFLRRGGDAGLPIDPDYKGKGLQLQFTVEDEGVFTAPWSALVTYRRGLAVWSENVCAEHVRATFVAKDSAVPRMDKPDF